MLKEERQLRVEGKLLAKDLSEALGISEDTVRRDLRELAEAGKLQRVHGGALPRSVVTGTHELADVRRRGARRRLRGRR